MNLWVTLGLVFGLVALGTYSVTAWFVARWELNQLRKRIGIQVGRHPDQGSVSPVLRERASPEEGRGEMGSGARPRPRLGMAGVKYAAQGLERLLARYSAGRWIDRRIRRAGLKLRPGEFMVVCAASGVVFFFLAYLLTGSGLAGGLAVGLGVWVPVHALVIIHRWRRKKVESAFADALDLVANSLKAGYSFLQAVEMVAREMPPPIGDEFGRVAKECRLNVPVEKALDNLVERLESPDIELVVTAVKVQQQVGGRLAEVLEGIGETIRERIRIQGEIRALTAQGRLSGWVISLLPLVLAFLAYTMNPEYILPLVEEPLGRLLLAGAVVMETVGILVIQRIIRVEV